MTLPGQAAGEPILRTENLTKRFGGVRAVNQVSLSIPAGQLCCLIGPNGAGKSTFSHLLTGLVRPDSGKIIFKNQDITWQAPFRRVRLGLGIKFQTNRAYHHLTVEQNLQAARGFQPFAQNERGKGRFEYALEQFGLAQTRHVLAKELPHHELQWLEICMALAANPDLLLLDEPTAGMSTEETAHTARVLKALHEDGLTMLVVEHDMAFVREVAARVIVFHEGQLFAEGTLDEVSADERVRRIYLGRV